MKFLISYYSIPKVLKIKPSNFCPEITVTSCYNHYTLPFILKTLARIKGGKEKKLFSYSKALELSATSSKKIRSLECPQNPRMISVYLSPFLLNLPFFFLSDFIFYCSQSTVFNLSQTL